MASGYLSVLTVSLASKPPSASVLGCGFTLHVLLLFSACGFHAGPARHADGSVPTFAGCRGPDGAAGRVPGQTGEGSLRGPAAREQSELPVIRLHRTGQWVRWF